MGLPTTATGPTNVYFLADDTGGGTALAGSGAGGMSGQQIVADFTAPSIAAAVQVAYLCSSALQRPVRLVTKYGSSATPPWTLVTGALANVALTSAPSGVGY